MLDALLRWVAGLPPSTTWLWVGASAAVEYLVPPVPGDTLVVFAIFLATHAGRSPAAVLAAATAGAIAGSLVAYAFGRALGRERARWPAFLREEARAARIEALLDRYAHHAGRWLAANRFLPAFRALFFVAAGMARVPVWKVVVFGGASAAVWNGLLLALGWTVATELDRLRAITDGYAKVVVGGVVLAALAWALRRRLRRGRGGRPSAPSRPPSTSSSRAGSRGSSGRSRTR